MVLNQPFFQVALPIVFTILIAVWVNNHGINKGFDGKNKRIDDVVARLGRIEDRLLALEAWR